MILQHQSNLKSLSTMTSLHKTLYTQNPTTLDQLMMWQTGRESSWKKQLENIEEEGPMMMNGEVKTALPPETPTETMEFLGRSWSISAVELTKAFFNSSTADTNSFLLSTLVNTNKDDREYEDDDSTSFASSRDFLLPHKGNKTSPPITPRTGREIKEEYKRMMMMMKRGKRKGRRMKEEKEKKKEERRSRKAEIHGAVCVAGVAAVVAATAARNAIASSDVGDGVESTRVAVAVASAAALIASHCIQMAGEIGAAYNHIATAVSSATSAKTNGDVMAITASAATALRGAAILRSRMERNNNENKAMLYSTKENLDLDERNVFGAMTFVSRGEELLKRTRKGDLHWKQVSFNINSNWQVVLKMKSKHVGGTFTKTKKCIVSGVCREIPEWANRGRVEKMEERRAYFGVKTIERVIEFECGNKREKQMWIEGIQQLLNSLEIGSNVHLNH